MRTHYLNYSKLLKLDLSYNLCYKEVIPKLLLLWRRRFICESFYRQLSKTA